MFFCQRKGGTDCEGLNRKSAEREKETAICGANSGRKWGKSSHRLEGEIQEEASHLLGQLFSEVQKEEAEVAAGGSTKEQEDLAPAGPS